MCSLYYYVESKQDTNKLTCKKIKSFEMQLYRHMLKMLWTNRITNRSVLDRMGNKEQQ